MDLLCEPDASGLLADLVCTMWTSCGPATSIIYKVRIHSRYRGTQQVQILFCYLTHQVHTGGPFSDLIRPSWFLPLMPN